MISFMVTRLHNNPEAGPWRTRPDLEELVGYLARSGSLTPSQAARLVDDVLAYLGETVEEFVRRRHAELQRGGAANRDIFERIGAELGGRRFRAAPLSERQIRRLIYG